MRKYIVELIEEQLEAITAIAKTEWGYGDSTDTFHVSIFTALLTAKPIQEQVWLPFTNVKEGRTYKTRDRRVYEVKTREAGINILYPFYADTEIIALCWTESGIYDLLTPEHQLDLVLELQ